jgi:hypothetical protein
MASNTTGGITVRFGYETTDSIGHGLSGELRGRETMAGRQRYANIGRPRGAGYPAATRHAQAEASDVEMRAMRLRVLLLDTPRS